MKKFISVLLSVFMVIPCISVFAQGHVIIDYNFDQTSTGTWQNIDKFDTVLYPDNDNNCIVMPGNGANQIVNNSGGAAKAYYGTTVFSGDIYPMTSSLNTQVFFKYYKLNAPKSGAAVDSAPPPHCIDFNGSNIKVHGNSRILGRFAEGEKYSFKIAVDGVNQNYKVYMSGIWDDEYHPKAEEESEEYPGYMLVDTYDYSEEYGAVGMVYIYAGKETSYADNLYMEAAEIDCETSEFTEGSTDITFDINQFIDTSTISELKLSRVSDAVTELEEGADYTLSWKIQMENYERAASLTITFAEPLGENEQIIFDFNGVKDSYGRNIEINTALPVNPDSDAINAVYADMLENWFAAKEIKACTVDAPDVITPQEGGSEVYITYKIEGAQNTSDETANTLVRYENNRIVARQPEAEECVEDLSSFDEHIKLTATLSCGKQPEQTLVREFTLKRRKLLDMAHEYGDERVAAISDDNDETAWETDGSKGELILHFDKAYAIGGITSKGDFSDIIYEVSDNNEDFVPVTKYPVKASALRITVSGDRKIRVTEIEPVISSFYEDVIARAEDLMTLRYTENITGLTEKKYLTLPKSTANGTPIIWSSSNRDVIDEYGTVTQKSSAQTVILTAHALDLRGNRITIAEKNYTATVAAKAVQSSSGGGGGGGGSVSGNKKPQLSYTAPFIQQAEPTASPAAGTDEKQENETYFDDMTDATWALEAVSQLAKQGIISGRSERSFAPHEHITREEFVHLIVKAFEISGKKSYAFSDVPNDAWYSKSINAAAEAGLVSGISDFEFGVGRNILRQDMAVILKRTADYKGLVSDKYTEIPDFKDDAEISEYAGEAMREMIEAKVISGNDGRLYPLEETTRAEAAVMLYHFLDGFREE